jgi:transcriptional regulator with XRE-family HTH domain
MHVCGMKLADYMAENGLTDDAVAQRIGRDRSFVTKLRQGRATPSLRTAQDLSLATNGAVSAEDFFPQPTQPQQGSASA